MGALRADVLEPVLTLQSRDNFTASTEPVRDILEIALGLGFRV